MHFLFEILLQNDSRGIPDEILSSLWFWLVLEEEQKLKAMIAHIIHAEQYIYLGLTSAETPLRCLSRAKAVPSLTGGCLFWQRVGE